MDVEWVLFSPPKTVLNPSLIERTMMYPRLNFKSVAAAALLASACLVGCASNTAALQQATASQISDQTMPSDIRIDSVKARRPDG